MLSKYTEGMRNSELDFTRGDISQHLKNVAIPTSVGFLFYTFYNVIDTYFAGTISSTALAALSLSFPLYFILVAFSVGLSTGATVVISNALGENKIDYARIVCIQALLLSVLLSAILTFFGLSVSEPLFRYLGAEGAYLEQTLLYIDVILYGSIFFVVTNVFNGILVAEGRTKPYRNILIVSFFINLILDPWFLYGGYGVPAMGVSGIALATLATQCISGLYLFREVIRGGLLKLDAFNSLIPSADAIFPLLYNGFPSALNMMSVSLGIFIVNFFISDFGEQVVAAYGVGMRVEQILLLPVIGLSSATLTIAGRNNGAGLSKRVIEVWTKSLKAGAIFSLPSTILLLLLAKPLIGFFTDDQKVIAEGVHYLRISSLAFFAYAALFVSTSALQGIKRPLFVIVLGVSRQIVLPFSVFYICINKLNYGVESVWWGTAAIVWISAIICIVFAKVKLNALQT